MKNAVKKGRFLKCLSSILALTVVTTSIGLPAGAVPAEPEENSRFVSSVEDNAWWWCMPSFSTKEGEGLFEFTRLQEPDPANRTHATYRWILVPVEGTGAYRIQCENSRQYLTVKDGSSEEEAQIVQTQNPGNAALWNVTEVKEGQFSIINYQTGKAITRGTPGQYGVAGDVYEVQKEYTGTEDQLWGFSYFDGEKQLHSITVDSGMTNGKVTANYKKTVSGETVYLSVIPDEGYEMTADSLKVNGEKVTGNSFVMPDQDVTIKAEFTQSQITGIRVKTQPDKTEYQINETLDLAGLVLEATYQGGSTKEITAGYEVSRVDMSTPGTKTVIVTYLGQTTELEIEVLKGENYTTNGIIHSAPPGLSYDPNRPSSRNSVLSPRALQLKYQDNPEDNGKMLATWESSVVEELPERQGKRLPIAESTDYGETWKEVGQIVEDTEKQDWPGDWEIENCPHIFELPADVGEMKKGGIVAVMDVCPRDLSQTYMDMYYSEDMGRTWKYMSTIVDDATNNYMGSDPVWEPFILYDPETEALVVYYSDERDPRWNQKLVLQYTTDGKNWSELIDVVAQTDSGMRPGMPVVTQMENGYYVMVFEGVGLNADGAGGGLGLPCNYKISLYPNDPIHWDPADIGHTFAYGGSPYVTTLADGHIAMNAGTQSPVYINTQKDLTGEFLTYPTGVPDGYNRQLIQIDDGTEKGALFTLSCEYADTGRSNSVKWGKLDLNTVTIPDTKATLYDINIDEDVKEVANVWPKEGQVISGADQYFMIQPKRGHEIQQVLVNGKPVHLYTSWIKVPTVREDINISIETTQVSNEARIINSKEDSQFYLVPPGYSTVDGREIFEWTLENNKHFCWVLEPDADTGAYRIKNMNTNMYLSVKGGSTAEGANIIQTKNLSDSSLWKLTEVEDGWFSIINYESGLAITRGQPGAFEGPTERFAVQKNYTGTDNQLWGFDYVLENRQLHNVNIDTAIKNGTVTANHKTAASGETVFLSVEANKGYKLVENSLKVNGTPVSGNSFIMPDKEVTITADFVRLAVSGISIKTQPNQTVYEVNDQLNLAGLVLEVIYEDGSKSEVAEGFDVSQVDMSTVGEKTITVTYQGKTAAFKVTVKETEKPVVTLESITISGPSKTEYKIGDKLDLTGLVVIAHYSDGSYQEVTDYEVSGFDSTAAGKKTITVRYVEDGITELAQFELTVKAKDTSSSGSDLNDPSDSNPNASSESNTNSNKPQTGDSFPLVAGIGVGFIALGCLGALITLRKRGRVG